MGGELQLIAVTVFWLTVPRSSMSSFYHLILSSSAPINLIILQALRAQVYHHLFCIAPKMLSSFWDCFPNEHRV